ncbi:MAG: molybdenum cofactor guanylyltransferase [Gammaproteobacteria bacterium]|nr:molybdenum cofactor guanylyltransferase [Gammaproteobacteria bacterium]MCY4226272.1 molybdenum cofactor guanylyltransferase [Gammaproteobacteria bacterium]MCY4312687.1 molybdenum cofactor guanylyltransferase [Gammaproteobacteria bacterium]
MNESSITGLVLAGGQARRMGGVDKGLIDIHGQTIVERITRQLKGQCANVMINANRNLEQYRQFGCAVIEDQIGGFQGPLAGMLSGLDSMRTEWLITAPCDGPFLSNTYAESMLQAAQSIGTPIAVAKDQERLQPVYILLHISTRDSLEAFLNSGERKIDRWFAEFNFAEVMIADCGDMFENINTPEQLEICRKKLSGKQSGY